MLQQKEKEKETRVPKGGVWGVSKVSFVETVIQDKGLEQEVSRSREKSILGPGGVEVSGLEHALLIPGPVVAAGPAEEKTGEEGLVGLFHFQWPVQGSEQSSD